MKGAVGMYTTTGSKRISVIIQDKKGRYLLAERLEMQEKRLDFPGFSCKGAKMADDEEGLSIVIEGIRDVLGIEIKEAKLIETFYEKIYNVIFYVPYGILLGLKGSKIFFMNSALIP